MLICSGLFSYSEREVSTIFYTNEEIENLPVRIIGKVVEARTKF